MDCVGERFFDHRLEQHRRLMLVKKDKLRIDVGFDGKLVQQARTEAVNRRDHATFERALVPQPRLSFLLRRRAQQRIDSIAHALPHFIRGAICESDRDDIVDRNFFRAQDFQVALDQDERFAGARTCGHGQMLIQRVRSDLLFGF